MGQTGWTLLLDLVLRLSVAAAIIARSRSSPSVRWAWLLVVLAIPFVGVVVYLILGEIWTGRGRLAAHRKIIERVRNSKSRDQQAPPVDPMEADLASHSIVHLTEKLGGFPLRPGNGLELFAEPDESLEAVAKDIDAATVCCHILTYIYLVDDTGRKIADVLLRASQRGVECRLLVDALGSGPFLRSSLHKELQNGGVQVRAALPLSSASRFGIRLDHRNHRKLIVIDGNIAWTGSRNVADAAFAIKPKYAPWVDVLMRITGPAVDDLQTLFAEDWLLEGDEPLDKLLVAAPVDSGTVARGCPVQVYGTGPTQHFQAVRQLALYAILSAKRELIITTPYFVPDESTVTAIHAAARSGVRVVLVVPKRNDSWLVGSASRSYYKELLVSGVELCEYRPGLLHAKTYTIDGEWSVVATANLDRRSFELNYEISLTVLDRDFTQKLRNVQIGYLKDSDAVDADEWAARPRVQRFIENATGMLAPLL